VTFIAVAFEYIRTGVTQEIVARPEGKKKEKQKQKGHQHRHRTRIRGTPGK
jgi:hypothetical protein